MSDELVLVGRSSSHFTRVARLFALELEVPHRFQPVFDITSPDAASYAGNPALKVPILVDAEGPLFGLENICRALTRHARQSAGVVLRGAIPKRVLANAEEMVLHAMSAEVTLIMAQTAGQQTSAKLRLGLENALAFLDANLEHALGELPAERTLSFLEAALFCVVRHLPFRQIAEVSAYPRLAAFCDAFELRSSAHATAYRFDRA